MSQLEKTISVPIALARHVTLEGNIAQHQLETFYYTLDSTLEAELIPDTLQIAPGGVVTFEAPWSGGPHIGHNLYSDPSRKEEALAAAKLRTTVIAGPLTLKQGGNALIVRHPIVLNYNSIEPEIWGLAIALINWDTISAKFSKLENDLGIDLQVYVQTLAKTKMAYPDIVNDVDFIETPNPRFFGLGKIFYRTDFTYKPSATALS